MHRLKKFAWILQGHGSDWRQAGVICYDGYEVILCNIKMSASPSCHCTIQYEHVSIQFLPPSFPLCLTHFVFLSLLPFPLPYSLTLNLSLRAHAP